MRTFFRSSPRRPRAAALAGALVSFTALTVASTPLAWAQDIDDQTPTVTVESGEQPPPGSFSFGSGDLGLGGSLPIDSANGRLQITIPVPVGTSPTALNAVIAVPAWVDRGWIDISSSQRPLTRIPLPGDVQTLPVTIALNTAGASGGAIVLDIASTLIPDAGYCPGPRTDPVRFLDVAVDYTGTPALPQTISEFLPPVLRQLTVFVPAESDDDVVAAALTLTTSVIEYYGAQNPRVVLRPDTELQGAAPDGPFERSVVLSANTDASVEVIYPLEPAPPRLFVSGSGTALLDQTRLITSTLADIAVSTKALAGSSAPPAVLASNFATLDSLGIGTITGSPTARVSIDQTRLARSVSNLSVHLIGTYTPGVGSITAAVGDSAVAVWPAEDTGILDRWIDIPDTDLSRVTALDITVTHPGSTGAGCPSQSTVTIDGSSTVESSASSTPTPLGFESLPQALMPRVNVAVTENTVAATARAVSILGGLQRLSTRPLSPRITSLADAVAGSEPAIVIAPGGALPDTLALPLASAGSTTLTVTTPEPDLASDTGEGLAGLPAEVTLDGALPFGSLQVSATDTGAPLLVASSNGAPEQLDSVLSWLDADTARWFSLTGDILLATPDRAPITLSSGVITSSNIDAAPTEGSGGISGLLLGSLAATAALFVGGLIAALALWRRRHAQTPGRRHLRGRGPGQDAADSNSTDDSVVDQDGAGRDSAR